MIKLFWNGEPMNTLGAGLLVAALGEGMHEQLVDLFGDYEARWIQRTARDFFALSVDRSAAHYQILENPDPDLYLEHPALIFEERDDGHTRPFRGEPHLHIRRSVTRKDLEREDAIAMPAFPHGDWPYYMEGPSFPSGRRKVPVVGFMGNVSAWRKAWIAAVIRDDRMVPWCIDRGGFSPGRPDFAPRRQQYIEHLSRCDYMLCPPGAGLYSYRLYEALSAGVKPVVAHHCGYPKGVRDASIVVTEPSVIPDAIAQDWAQEADSPARLRSIQARFDLFCAPSSWVAQLHERIRNE